VNDAQTGKWVDLKDPEIAVLISYMTGTDVPGVGTIAAAIVGLTADIATAVTAVPPTSFEQLGLVKLYFS